MILYFFHSSAESQRVRLALGFKRLAHEEHPLGYDDDETFFELGVARTVPLLKTGDTLLTDSLRILETLDSLEPERPILTGVVPPEAWRALLDWRASVEALFARLHAPVAPAYADIGASEQTLAQYKAEVAGRFGMSLEELANDRYSAFAQLARASRLPELARHLARERFYLGWPTAADMLLAADLSPLTLLDGVSLPIDLVYYIERVEAECGVSLRDGLLTA